MPNDHIALGSGEGEQQGATPMGSGHPSSTEPLTGLGPAGGSPSRMQWRPIETAPINYTEIIGMDANGTIAKTWFFAPSSQTRNWLRVGLPGKPQWKPAWWMPLPSAPCDEPPAGGDAPAAPGRSPAGAVAEGEAPDSSPTREQLQAEIDALTAKIDSLAPHGSCACSYDRPGDVCLHHSPALAAAQAEVERLKTVLDFRIRALRTAETERDHLRSDRDMLAHQAGACAEEVDRLRVAIGAAQAERDQARTALSDSESKRAVLDREVHSFIGCVEALQRHVNPFDVHEGHSQQWFAVHDAIQTRIKPLLASTPSPQETARVED